MRKYPRFENQVRLQIKSCADFGPTKMVGDFGLPAWNFLDIYFQIDKLYFSSQMENTLCILQTDSFIKYQKTLPAELNKIYSSKVRKMIDFLSISNKKKGALQRMSDKSKSFEEQKSSCFFERNFIFPNSEKSLKTISTQLTKNIEGLIF